MAFAATELAGVRRYTFALSFGIFAFAILSFVLLALALVVHVGVVAKTFPFLLALGLAAFVLSFSFPFLFTFHSVNIHADHLIVPFVVLGDGQFLVDCLAPP